VDFERWTALSAGEQERLAQTLNPYEDWPLFKAIEKAFRSEHASNPAVIEVFCGFAAGLGSLNAVTVTIGKGSRVRLPKKYLGLPVLRRHTAVE
jgi:hypothetical protein